MSTEDDVYFSVPGVATVKWDASSETVCVEWDGWANTSEFRSLLDAEVKALRDHRASRLLADCRRQRVLNPADQERADKEWVPLALEAGLRRFAIVLPESDIAAGHLRERLGKVSPTAMQIAYFASVEEALEWLAR
ncbi:MAG TPA: STAS/SEC14 domain-containing protein [Candidatus Limnocylindrales bacterium]|nr:STAS/SEC14 domain-containing protein [Candidatus Limnocylindrales bacterium]